MDVIFSDGDRWSDFCRAAWHRVCGGRRQWHNRRFTPGQSIERTGDGWTVRWRNHGELKARHVSALPRVGTAASILASGPSVRGLRRPQRLFSQPLACVNGAVLMANDLGYRTTYYVVSDHRFILTQPDVFRLGVGLADAVVLGASAAFTALRHAPGAVRDAELLGTPIFLREDLRRPFKRPRPTIAEMRRDPALLMLPGSDLAFSLDPAAGTWPAGTVVYEVLQLLFGAGYRELFMFGVDLTEEPRFYAEDAPAPNCLGEAYERSIEPAFRLVREHLRRSGCTLVNGSAVSRLPADIVPKMDGSLLLDLLDLRGGARDAGRAVRPAA